MSLAQVAFESQYFAAVDLGSNSFHMLIARIQDGQVDIVDRVKEMVQIARGVKRNGHLSVESQTRALECLSRFAERIRDIPKEQIRAVATKTLRSASKIRPFLKAAEKTLGVPIQIISGFEEARLVYTGLSHAVINDHNQRLVVDIGGGSTEFIIGQDYDPISLESRSIGCVTYTESYIGKTSKLSKSAMKRAYMAACAEIVGIRKDYLKTGWNIAYGTSGTVRAIADLTAEKDGGAVITKSSLEWLVGEMVSNRSRLANVPELRRSVLPAGIAILQAIFDQLRLDTMHVGDAALKEGLLFDTIGRMSDHDSREQTVRNLQLQYKVDLDQAARVASTAQYFWSQVNGPILPGVSRTKVLNWAALLHEIGLSISHSSHHHHGYYILRYSDIAGFGRYEQYILANLVRSHRMSLYLEKFEDLDEATMTACVPILVCLRLAALLHRRREDIEALPKLSVKGAIYKLKFDKGWLRENPLTFASLQQEKEYYDNIGIGLIFK